MEKKKVDYKITHVNINLNDIDDEGGLMILRMMFLNTSYLQ